MNSHEQADRLDNLFGGERPVMMTGWQGRVVRGRTPIRSMWTVAAKRWFPDGPDAEDIALREVAPIHAEYWDGLSNMVSRALALATCFAAGRPIGLGEHGEIDLASPLRP